MKIILWVAYTQNISEIFQFREYFLKIIRVLGPLEINNEFKCPTSCESST